MFKKISTTIINLLFKCLLKWGILHLAKILFAILFPLYLASLIKKRLLPVYFIIFYHEYSEKPKKYKNFFIIEKNNSFNIAVTCNRKQNKYNIMHLGKMK